MPTMKCSECGTIFHIYAEPCPICAVKKGLRNHYDPRLSHLSNDLWRIYSSASTGDAKSANFLGKCYFVGDGIEKDFEEAVFWFVKGAIGGNDSAIYHLGICFARGCGVEANPFFAYMCFTEARTRNNGSAKIALEKLKQEISGDYELSGLIEKWEEQNTEWQKKQEKGQREILQHGQIGKEVCNPEKYIPRAPLNLKIKRVENGEFIPGETKLFFLDGTGWYQEATFHHFDCKNGQTVIYVSVGETLKFFGYPGCMGVTLHKRVPDKYKLKDVMQETVDDAVQEVQRFPSAEFVSGDIDEENEKEKKKLNAICSEIDKEKEHIYYEVKSAAESIYSFGQLRAAFIDARENGVDIYSSYSQVMRAEERAAEAKKVRAAADTRIHELDIIKKKPYFCRMDIGEDRSALHSVYVGLSDFKNVIVDWRNKTLGSLYQLSKFYANITNFCFALKRNIQIKEAVVNGDNGVYQGFTDEINVYKTNDENSFQITDTLFNQLLEENRLNVEMHNIVRSIQENQYRIITAPLGENLLVNGCAGSGKTMILYHRLSFLLYNNRHMEAKDIFVITPNRLFNVLVKELLAELHLDEIVNLSKIDFWEFIIKQYNNELFPSDEMNGNPLYCCYDDAAQNSYCSAVHAICEKTELTDRFVQWEIKQIYYELKELSSLKKVDFNTTQVGIKNENICGYSEKDLFTGGKYIKRAKREGKEAELEDLFQYYIKFKDKRSDSVIEIMVRVIARFRALQSFLKGNNERIYIDICRYAVYRVNTELKISYENTLDANAFIVYMLAEKFGTKFKDGCLFIDEFQNYSMTELRWLRKIFSSVHICLFGDVLQRLEKIGITDIAQLQEVMPVQVFTINENYRNAKEITEFINDRLGMSMLPIGLHGKVEYISAEDADFNQEKQIAVIVKDETVWMNLRQKNNILLQQSVQFSDYRRNLSGNIDVFSVSQVKGLEFPVVYVCDWGMTKNEKYVAYTRALNELYIFN